MSKMRICIPIDYGIKANVTSLNVIVKNLFLELGKIMNQRRSFTIIATRLDNVIMGDINQHSDCVSVPNMGGFRFPPKSVFASNNLFIGLVGIDEVILGRKAYKSDTEWKINRPVIEKELKKWRDGVEKIKLIHVSTVSEKQQMIEYLKIPEEKIVVIPLGVDHEKFKPPVDKDKIRKKILSKYFLKNQPYFLHVSERNWARKNVFRMFEAFKKAKLSGLSHNLIVVGKNDPIVYKKAREIFGIFIIGYVDEKDLVELMQGADALLNPSLHEGFGLPILEAMACQVPIIASNSFSPPEVVKEGGLFVDPYNTDDICEKIVEMGKNEKLRTTMADNAFKRSNDFSWKYFAEMLLDVFEKNIPSNKEIEYDEDYDLAALRTITTVMELDPRFNLTFDLLKMDYSRMINWSFNHGLQDSFAKDYLEPFKEWMESHSHTLLNNKYQFSDDT